MHDTILFQKILQGLQKLCKENDIKHITKFDITVRHNSHVQEESLRDHMTLHDPVLMSQNPDIKVNRADIEECTCMINTVEGERSYE